ncbi:hypothetical protein RDI58_014447 [Solanum bulbocastanum]|uniref:Uncharacterized protein n=1 Tax=Solanum bulbocastanum TaxID=147425 RepID=A0AAN8YB20_SOLBU
MPASIIEINQMDIVEFEEGCLFLFFFIFTQ